MAAPLLFVFFILSFFSVSIAADDRAHGLSIQSPVAISPSAYAFFHPKALQPAAAPPCASSKCSSIPLAATVRSTPAHESTAAAGGGGGRGLGAGGIAGISLSVLFVCLVGMGVFYVIVKRRKNSEKDDSEQLPNV